MPIEAVAFATVAARPTAVVAQATTWRAFPQLWPRLLDEVYAVVRSAPDEHQDSERERWQNVMVYRDDVPNVEVGVLATAPLAPRGRVTSSQLPGGAVATLVHRGPYDGLEAAHRAVRDACSARGLAITGVRWEVYGHWRADPRALETEVSYLLASSDGR